MTYTKPTIPPSDPVAEERIPDAYISEVIDGYRYPYKGAREAIEHNETPESIMGDSGLQAYIKRLLFLHILQALGNRPYEVFSGEIGLHIDNNNNLSLDLTIFNRNELTPDKITTSFVGVIPKIVIEIDVNVESPKLDSIEGYNFLLKKINRLHAAGVERVIWIFTKDRKIVVTESEKLWHVLDLNESIDVMEGVAFNLLELLGAEGISLEEDQIDT